MAQFTYEELKDICPDQTEIALIKLNGLLGSLSALNIHMDVGIYNIACQHKGKSDSLVHVFQHLKALALEKLNQRDIYYGNDTVALVDRSLRAFVARLAACRQLNCIKVFPCMDEDHLIWLDRDAKIDAAVLMHGQSNQVLLNKLNLIDVAFEVQCNIGICIHPFPIWEEELKRYPEARLNPLLLRDIERDERSS